MLRFRHIILAMLLSVASVAFGASVRLSVDAPRGKRAIEVGDIFYITYEVSNLDAAPSRPSAVDGAKVMYFDRTGQSTSVTSVNGKVTQSSSFIYTLTLRAQKEGSYTFGPVSVGGVKSNQISYHIGHASARQQQQPGPQASASGAPDSGKPKFIGKGDGNLYLRANVSKSTAYEQEALVYTVKLYTTYDAIKFIGATAAPKFENFVVEESKDVSSSLSYETVNGKTYATAIIARYIIFPQMAGTLKITGNTYTVSVDEREYFHDPWFGRMSVPKPLQLNVTPNDLQVKVNPLPLPKPADFSGGVGEFKITSSLPQQQFMSNQAASIVYTVTGTGNLKYVTLPDLNKLYPSQLEVYSATPEVNATVGSSNVSGSSRFDYSFMPLESGSFSIPSVTLTYFNPRSGVYEKSTALGYQINVGQGKGSAKSQTLARKSFDDKLMPVDMNLTPHYRPYVRGFAFWLWYIVPVALLIASVIYYRRYLRLNSDIMAVRSRKAGSIARKSLRKAEQCLRRDDGDHFYDEMLTALWGYLSHKLRMPTSELSRDNVRSVLEEYGAAHESIDALISLLDECEFAKYSSSSSSVSMRQVYDEGVNVINQLESSFKANKGKNNEK